VDHYELRACLHRIAAFEHHRAAALHEIAASCAMAARGVHRLAAALTASEYQEVVQHPDLAELDVQLEGFYGTP
jgi:hypothetical protein